MDIYEYIAGTENEKPLDRIVTDGGFCAIFRTIACIGDSLSSGEFESRNAEGKPGYHDYYEYSWGQYIARKNGLKAYNFSRGGMSAKQYMESFAENNGFWDPALACQAYVMALGVNDVINMGMEIGSLEDIDPNDWRNNKPTFVGYYAQIIARIKDEIQPQAKFFYVTMMDHDGDPALNEKRKKHADALYALTEYFDNSYVIDLYQYGPKYDAAYREKYNLYGHLNPMGYVLTAKMVDSYIDYIIRANPDDFRRVPFIGKGLK
jgi:lysophospholipase L1-like esterase